MNIDSWQAQLRKGAAELVVLASLRAGERYGVQILAAVNRAGGIVTEGALYPLLSRLEKEGKVASRWETADGPHPRKYYALTETGRGLLGEMTQAWVQFRVAMTGVVEEEER